MSGYQTPSVGIVNKVSVRCPNLFYNGCRIMYKVYDKDMILYHKRDFNSVPSKTIFVIDLPITITTCSLLILLNKKPFINL